MKIRVRVIFFRVCSQIMILFLCVLICLLFVCGVRGFGNLIIPYCRTYLSFQDVIRKSINDRIRFQRAFPNIKEWWDFLKRSLKEKSIEFAKQKRAEANRERVFLTNKLITLKRRLVNKNVQQIVDYETRLKALIERETAGA